MAEIDAFFNQMKGRGASDLHMVIGFPPLLRIRGDLVPLDAPVLTAESNRQILFEILTPEQQKLWRQKLQPVYDKLIEKHGQPMKDWMATLSQITGR